MIFFFLLIGKYSSVLDVDRVGLINEFMNLDLLCLVLDFLCICLIREEDCVGRTADHGYCGVSLTKEECEGPLVQIFSRGWFYVNESVTNQEECSAQVCSPQRQRERERLRMRLGVSSRRD